MGTHDPASHADGQAAVRKDRHYIFRWVDNTLEFVCAALLVEIVILLFANAMARYVFSISMHWADEVVRYSFTWLAFLSGALVMRFGSHMAMDLFADVFPKRIARAIWVVVECLVIAFLCALVVYSWQMAVIAAGQTSSTLRISMFYVYLAAPVGSAFMLFYSLMHLIISFGSGGIMSRKDKESFQ